MYNIEKELSKIWDPSYARNISEYEDCATTQKTFTK